MGRVVMYASVSVDGFIADENDQPGPLFDWLTSGDVPLDDGGFLSHPNLRRRATGNQACWPLSFGSGTISPSCTMPSGSG